MTASVHKKGRRAPLKYTLILPLFIDVSVPSKESERLCIFVLKVSILTLSTILVLHFGAVICFLHFITQVKRYSGNI
jgi:hypothetical protein